MSDSKSKRGGGSRWREDDARAWSRRRFVAQAAATGAGVALLPFVRAALAAESKMGDRSRVHRYSGTSHLPIGQIAGTDSHLAVSVPRSFYMLPCRPRPAALAGSADLPISWMWKAFDEPNWDFSGGALVVSVIPRLVGEAAEKTQEKLLRSVPALIKLVNLHRSPQEAPETAQRRISIRGLPKATRKCTVVYFETRAKTQWRARYAMILIPIEGATLLVWIAERQGMSIIKHFERGLEVIEPAKRPVSAAPLGLWLPMGDWVLHCGIEQPKGFRPDFKTDLAAAATWTKADEARWTLHIDGLHAAGALPKFADHHRGLLANSMPGAKVDEQSIAHEGERYSLLTFVAQGPKGAVRTALVGTQDSRARLSMYVEDAPGKADAVAKWGRRVGRDVLKRFQYWYVQEYEAWSRTLGR